MVALLFDNKSLKKLIVPLIIEQFLAVMVGMADIMMVSSAGEAAVSSVALVDLINVLIINIFAALATGGAVVCAQSIGAGHLDQANRSANQLVYIVSAISVALMVLVLLFSRALLGVLFGQVEPPVMEGAITYFVISALSYPFIAVYNGCAALLRSMGNSRASMYVSALMNGLNVVGNAILVFGFSMGVAGVALATVISQCISAGLVLLCLMHAEGPYRVDLRRLRIRRAKLLQIMRIGLPAGVQGAIFSISNVLIQSSINSFGSVAMAGNSAASNLEGFIYTSMNAVYQTSLNFTSQNLGAGKRSRLMPILLRCLGVVFAIGALLGLIFYLLRYPLLGVYTSDPEVVSFSILRLELICSTYFLCGMMEVCCGSLRGLGYSVLPTVISLTGACGLRVVWIFTVFAIDRSLWTLYLSYPVSWGLTALAHFICFLVVLKRQGGTKDVPPQTAAAK